MWYQGIFAILQWFKLAQLQFWKLLYIQLYVFMFEFEYLVFCWSMWYAAYKWLYTASTMSNVCSYQQQHRLSKHISFTLIETNLKSRIWNFRWLRYAATMSNVCAYQQEEFLRPQPDTLSDLTPKPWAHQHVHINMNTHQHEYTPKYHHKTQKRNNSKTSPSSPSPSRSGDPPSISGTESRIIKPLVSKRPGKKSEI